MIYETVLAIIENPVAIPAYAILAMAASMFPVGLMLGSSCSSCCSPCGCPAEQTMPDEVKVTFSGVTQNANKIEGLLSLEFNSCFGTGGSGGVTATGGLPNEGGPITSVSLTNGGYGYAVLGHVEPTGLTITGGGGEGAEFEISLASTKDDCGLPAWSISSVKVTKQAEGYTDGAVLSVSLGSDEHEIEPASLTLLTVPSEPELTAIVTPPGPGFGAVLAVTTKTVSTNPNRWGVDQISVSSGGSFYDDQDPVAVNVEGDGVQVSAAVAKARTRRDPPQIEYEYKTGPGSGATFATTVTKISGSSPVEYEVSSVTVTSGGSGYQAGNTVFFQRVYSPRTTQLVQASYSIASVSPTGAILSLSKINGGRYWTDSGVVESVDVTNPGSYYGPSTTAGYVTVQDGGKFYKTSEEVPAHVAPITISVVQQPPSSGSGAVIKATVDSTVGSPSFGSITELTIEDGGDDYVAWSYDLGPCCASRINNWTAFLRRTSNTSCEYSGVCCGTGDVRVVYRGSNVPPLVFLNSQSDRRYCRVSFEGRQQDAPFACDPMSFTAYDVFGGTATVQEASSSEKKGDFPCPPCCSKTPEDSATTCYTQQECAENDGAWLMKCECSGCYGCETAQSLIVTVTLSVRWYKIDTSVHYPLGFNPPGVPEFYNVVAGQFVDDVQEHTITLNAENGWSEVSDDWIPPSCQVCYDGTGASAFMGNSEDLAACTVYAKAWADWIEGYVLMCSFNQSYAPDGSLNPQWCQIFKTGQYKPIFALSGNRLLGLPLYFRGGGLFIPNADGCFTGGAERTTVYENWWFDQPASITVSVTVAT